MPSPLSVKKNNYIKNPKRSDIPTPENVAYFITSLFPREKFVFDPCCGDGALLVPFIEKGIETHGIDIKRGENFLSFHPSHFHFKPSLVVCNPPFNLGVGKKLGSEIFLEHIIKCFPYTKIVLFVPMGFRLNQRKTSKRWKWLRDNCLPITSIISLPLDIFDKIQFHNEILIFNAPKLKAHYFLPKECHLLTQ